ncbi:hypothetical protein EXN66_Car017089 [Channa argus]|uniref:Uncharacterized protein n=1 Tax=Channa argus TaxID=215402 RepID=A0A6G1QFF8_CHAAH|nr:hypothetical protein EXN66_Car017089 [Channa argus]
MTDDHKQEYMCFRKSAQLSYEKRESMALAGIYEEHPKQTHFPAQLASTQGQK